ncbi:MAG TPA: FHA domain-containing protein [Thermoanaerobaculia bacterium]|nr:FHA domain-containing protein [Thermoanaerobaculia bacterium]
MVAIMIACGETLTHVGEWNRECGEIPSADRGSIGDGNPFSLTFGRREFLLPFGQTTIGRGPDTEIVLDSRSISRRHARITVDDEGVTIEDAGSKNGTFVDGVRIEGPMQITPASRIRLGQAWITLVMVERSR